ncbi:MAG: ATP-binding protein [Syntrophorhabdus sp.]
MFQLRHKLLFGFGGLLLIILIVGIQSITRVAQLGGSIDVILRENYRSVIACEQMKEAAERIDSGTLFVLLGERQKGEDLIEENLPRFAESLQIELDNITLPGEKDRAWRLRDTFGRYRSLLAEFRSDRTMPVSSRRDLYFDRLLPTFYEIKNIADSILVMNQKNMEDSRDRAKRLAARSRRHMYVLVIAGIVIGLGFIFLAGKWILRPISRLTRFAVEIKNGNFERVVPVDSHDEIGTLSEAFNQMAAAVREFRRSDREKVYRYQKATQAAFNSLPEAIAVIDLNGQVEVATPPAKDIFGLTPNTPIGMLPDLSLDQLYRDVRRKGKPIEAEGDHGIVQRFVKNSERYFRPHGIPIIGHEGQINGVVLILQDITLLRQQDEMKRSVISTVSHQLKTPLISLEMAVHILLTEKPGMLNAKQGELLVIAREESERLRTIVDDLLDISRIESGKAKMNLIPVFPGPLIIRNLEAFRWPAQEQGVVLATDIEPGLPAVCVDIMQIGHVFSNLLSNALKYTPPGGNVTVAAKSAGPRVSFSVTDTGKGMPREYRQKMFEKFVQLPGDDPKRGAGLGLSIVKDIVTAHGGDIGIDSTEGKGTTVTFFLPGTITECEGNNS